MPSSHVLEHGGKGSHASCDRHVGKYNSRASDEDILIKLGEVLTV